MEEKNHLNLKEFSLIPLIKNNEKIFFMNNKGELFENKEKQIHITNTESFDYIFLFDPFRSLVLIK